MYWVNNFKQDVQSVDFIDRSEVTTGCSSTVVPHSLSHPQPSSIDTSVICMSLNSRVSPLLLDHYTFSWLDGWRSNSHTFDKDSRRCNKFGTSYSLNALPFNLWKFLLKKAMVEIVINCWLLLQSQTIYLLYSKVLLKVASRP